MDREGVDQGARVQVPQTHSEVCPSREQVCGVVCHAVVIGVEEAGDLARVLGEEAVLRPT